MSDEVKVYPKKIRVIKISPWEKELREWYAANPPSQLTYQYCERMTACISPMSSELFSEIYKKLTAEDSKVLAVKLTLTYGDTVCRMGEEFNKKLGRMAAWRRAKTIDLWVREASLFNGLITLTAYESPDNYGGHLRLEFTRWRDPNAKVRTRILGLSEHFTRCKSYNEKWRR